MERFLAQVSRTHTHTHTHKLDLRCQANQMKGDNLALYEKLRYERAYRHRPGADVAGPCVECC